MEGVEILPTPETPEVGRLGGCRLPELAARQGRGGWGSVLEDAGDGAAEDLDRHGAEVV